MQVGYAQSSLRIKANGPLRLLSRGSEGQPELLGDEGPTCYWCLLKLLACPRISHPTVNPINTGPTNTPSLLVSRSSRPFRNGLNGRSNAQVEQLEVPDLDGFSPLQLALRKKHWEAARLDQPIAIDFHAQRMGLFASCAKADFDERNSCRMMLRMQSHTVALLRSGWVMLFGSKGDGACDTPVVLQHHP